jgi:hypothetical protein
LVLLLSVLVPLLSDLVPLLSVLIPLLSVLVPLLSDLVPLLSVLIPLLSVLVPLFVGFGTLIVGIGTLIVGIGTLIVGIGTITAYLLYKVSGPSGCRSARVPRLPSLQHASHSAHARWAGTRSRPRRSVAVHAATAGRAQDGRRANWSWHRRQRHLSPTSLVQAAANRDRTISLEREPPDGSAAASPQQAGECIVLKYPFRISTVSCGW